MCYGEKRSGAYNKELKEKIQDLPDDMEVYIDERLTEYHYSLVNSGKVREISILERREEIEQVFILIES